MGKIRILYISGSAFGGADKSLLDLIHSVRDNIEPIVLFARDDKAYKVFVQEGIESIVHPFMTVYLPYDYYKMILFHPQRIRIVKHFLYDIPCRKYVKDVLGGRHVDLVHSNYTLTAFGVQMAKTLKVPHVWHIREYLDKPHFDAKIYLGRERLKKRINSADARVVVSNSCREYWQLKKEDTYTIWDAVCGVNDCCYEKEKQPYILFCSSLLSEVKGVFDAISAYGMSGLKTQGIRLKLVGKSSESVTKQIINTAAEYGCVNSVDIIPIQDDVKPLFAHAMAFVNPSVNEGMGRTTAEAMFYGCPVIAHASGGTLDLIKDNETGYLFKTVDELAVLLKKICMTNQEEVILKAQEFAKNNLSVENYGEKIMEVYEKVLKTNN